MTLEEIVRLGLEQKATDIHLEPRTQIALRIGGSLKRMAFAPSAERLLEFAENLLSTEQIEAFEVRGSADFSRTIAGVPCRLNVLKSDRGVGLVIRLLATSSPSLKSCNLHPSIAEFLQRDSGLLILTGPTGSGKSTTLTALLEEINTRESRHIVTLESPIEYRLTPKKSMIRQREIGLHTPSFEQGLLDSLREDPDILVVGEMRESETIRLTLNAAETGHLVLATMHSASAMEAVYRIMMSFSSERQSSVLAQVADTLIAIVSHKMTFRSSQSLLVPCCEIMVANHATRNVIRKGDVSKMPSLLQTGGPEGMYTFERYQSWLDQKEDWTFPTAPTVVEAESEVPAPVRSLKRKRPKSEPSYQRSESSEETLDTPTEIFTPAPEPLEFPRRSTQTEGGDQLTRRRRPPRPMLDVQPKASSEMDEEIARQLAGAPERLSDELQAASARPRGKRGQGAAITRIHKDGRIEIPEVELDLDELVREFETKQK